MRMGLMRLSARGREAYIAGMKRYQAQGVSVLIDGKEANEASWDKLFEMRRDGRFYMADYIFEGDPLLEEEEEQEEPETDCFGSVYGQTGGAVRPQLAGVCEEAASYRARGRLKEIRFDKVYNR